MDTSVYSTSGLKIHQATKQIVKIYDDHRIGDTAVLQVGTCDLDTSSQDELVSKYNVLIDTVKTISPGAKLLVTAIAHRIYAGSAALYKEADYLNSKLRLRASKQKDIYFIDANPKLVDFNYRSDGLHFNHNGCSFFSKYLSNSVSHSLNFPLKKTMYKS